MLHGEQQCNTEIENWKKSRLLHSVLCCCIGIKSATPKLKIGNHEIRNSDFCREKALVSLHVLWCHMQIIVQHWNQKSEVIPISAFLLHVLWCYIMSNSARLKIKNQNNSHFPHSTACALLLHGDKSTIPKSEIENLEIGNSDFHKEMSLVLLHVLCCCIGSNSATLKSKIGRNSTFCILLHVLCCHMGIKVQHQNWKLGTLK